MGKPPVLEPLVAPFLLLLNKGEWERWVRILISFCVMSSKNVVAGLGLYSTFSSLENPSLCHLLVEATPQYVTEKGKVLFLLLKLHSQDSPPDTFVLGPP